MSRKLVHWFDRGEYRNGQVLGVFTLTLDHLDEDQHGSDKLLGSTFLSFINPNDDDGLAEYVVTNALNGVPVYVLTGRVLIPKHFTADTKDDAFQKYVQRLAVGNNINLDYSE